MEELMHFNSIYRPFPSNKKALKNYSELIIYVQNKTTFYVLRNHFIIRNLANIGAHSRLVTFSYLNFTLKVD